VPLTPQSTNLSEVIISSQKGNTNKIFEAGTYNNPEENIKILYSKLKIGSLIKHPEPLKKLFLNGIKFKLGDVKFKNINARLEINLYPIENGKVSKYTLNSTPILIALNKLKKHNIVSLGQSIEIPEEGFIISFELPAIFNEGKKMSIEFLEDWSSETCVTRVMPNNGMEWEDWPFNDCKSMHFTGKYDRLSINILYHK